MFLKGRPPQCDGVNDRKSRVGVSAERTAPPGAKSPRRRRDLDSRGWSAAASAASETHGEEESNYRAQEGRHNTCNILHSKLLCRLWLLSRAQIILGVPTVGSSVLTWNDSSCSLGKSASNADCSLGKSASNADYSLGKSTSNADYSLGKSIKF